MSTALTINEKQYPAKTVGPNSGKHSEPNQTRNVTTTERRGTPSEKTGNKNNTNTRRQKERTLHSTRLCLGLLNKVFPASPFPPSPPQKSKRQVLVITTFSLLWPLSFLPADQVFKIKNVSDTCGTVSILFIFFSLSYQGVILVQYISACDLCA